MSNTHPDLRDPRITVAANLLAANLQRPWTSHTIALEVGLSSSRLRQLFVEVNGVPPMHYLRTLRLARANEILRTSFTTVTETAAIVGFNDYSHFVRSYKVCYQESPGFTRRRRHRAFGVEQSPSVSDNE